MLRRSYPACAMRETRFFHSPAFGILFIILLVLFISPNVAPAASVGAAAVSHAEYAVQVTGRFATVRVTLTVMTSGGDWQSLPLVPSTIALRSFQVIGKRGYIQKGADSYTAELFGGGKYIVELEFALDVDSRGSEGELTLPLVRSATGVVRLSLEAPNDAVESAPKVPVETVEQRGRTVATLYPGDARSLHIRWLPAELIRERPAIFEAREESILSVETGAIRSETSIGVTIQRGELGSLALAIPEGVDVLGLRASAGRASVNLPAGGSNAAEESVLGDWRIEGEGAQRKACIRFTRPLTEAFRLDIASEQNFGESARTVSVLPFTVEGAARQSGIMGVQAAPALNVVDAGSSGLARAAVVAFSERVKLDRPEAVLAFQYPILPAELKLRITPVPPRIVATTASLVKLQAGVVELLARLTYHVENAPVERLNIGLDEGLLVLTVTGEGIETWDVKDGRIEVRMKRPILGDRALTVRCLQNLRKVDGVLIPRLRCLDAERESGEVGITAGADIALQHYRSEKVVQVELSKLSEWLRASQPKLGYVYDQPEGMLAVSTNLIRPVLRVEAYGVARVAEDAVHEEYVFACVVERQPLFNLFLQAPEGLTPTSLLGDQVEDWELHPDQGVISVTFRKGVLGRMQLHLFCERRIKAGRPPPADAGDLAQPPAILRIPLGGVAIRGADQVSGWFAVAVDANLDLKPIEPRALIPADVNSLPPLLATYRNLRLAFTWSAEDWRLTADAAPVAPRIEAETRTALLFGAGLMRARTDAVWRISKATLDELLVRLPPGAVNSVVTGRGMRSRELVGDTWQIRLDDPVQGEYSARVTYEQLPDAAGAIAYAGIVLPQAERESAVIGAYLEDPQVGVTVGEMANAARAQSAPGVDMGRFPFLDAFASSQPQRRIVFQMKSHALAAGVTLRAEHCTISTVVQETGRAVSFMNCRLRNTGAQFFRMTLPPGAVLWGAYVQGNPVKPDRQAPSATRSAPSSEGEVLIPVLDAPRNASFDLGVIWAEPSQVMGLTASLALASPGLGLPAEDMDWEVFLPRNYQLITSAGNMKLLERAAWHEEGLPGAALEYGRTVWRPLRKILIAVAVVLVGIMALCGLIRLLRWAARTAKAHREARQAEGLEPIALRTRIIEVAVVLIILLILAGMLLPSLSRAREESRRSSCDSNLAQIGKAIFTYMEPNGDWTPPFLEKLYPAYIDNLRVFNCPSTEDRTGEVSYIYAGGIAPGEAKSDTPLVWDKAGNHEGGGNVLFYDGHVKWVESTSSLGRSLGFMTAEELEATVSGRRMSAKSNLQPELGVAGRPPAAAPAPMATTPAAMAAPTLLAPGEGAVPLAGEAAQVERMAQFGFRDRSAKAKQLGDAYLKRGDYKAAEEQYRQALKETPEDKDLVGALSRVQELEKVAIEGGARGGLDSSARLTLTAKKPVLDQTFGAGPIAAYADELKKTLPQGWQNEVAEDNVQRDLLALVNGEKSRIEVEGGTVELKAGGLAVHGTQEAAQAVERAVSRLQARMLEDARRITVEKQKREAELAAQQRAEIERRMAASAIGAGLKGGTLAGSRGVGAMPLEISFPSFGTRAYPFHLDYAGTSQARIELRCVRAGTAMVLQALIALAVLFGLGILSWRHVRVGLVLSAALALLLLFLWKVGGEAPKQYLAMALTGLCLVAPVILARLVLMSRSEN